MSTIKEAVLSTISEHIESQNAKGRKDCSQSSDERSVDADSWSDMIIEKLIDALQYQQKENQKLRRDLQTAELHGEMHRLMNMQKGEL